nr:MAG TPA: hypothetical protein [Caudoviricetes sp.]
MAISPPGLFITSPKLKTGKHLPHLPKFSHTAKHFSKAYNNTP